MISKNKERNTAIFYTCGVCNLHCRYCGIDKNPVLGKIDKKLEESFNDPDYYLLTSIENKISTLFKALYASTSALEDAATPSDAAPADVV